MAVSPPPNGLACAKDETKLWLISSAKQRQNPWSGSQAVYQNLSMQHNWSVKNAIDCQFVSQVERKYKTHFWQFIESINSPEQGYWHYFTDVTNQVKSNYLSVMQVSKSFLQMIFKIKTIKQTKCPMSLTYRLVVEEHLWPSSAGSAV